MIAKTLFLLFVFVYNCSAFAAIQTDILDRLIEAGFAVRDGRINKNMVHISHIMREHGAVPETTTSDLGKVHNNINFVLRTITSSSSNEPDMYNNPEQNDVLKEYLISFGLLPRDIDLRTPVEQQPPLLNRVVNVLVAFCNFLNINIQDEIGFQTALIQTRERKDLDHNFIVLASRILMKTSLVKCRFNDKRMSDQQKVTLFMKDLITQGSNLFITEINRSDESRSNKELWNFEVPQIDIITSVISLKDNVRISFPEKTTHISFCIKRKTPPEVLSFYAISPHVFVNPRVNDAMANATNTLKKLEELLSISPT